MSARVPVSTALHIALDQDARPKKSGGLSMATAIPAHAVIASFRFEDGAGNALSKLKDISKAQGIGVQNAAVLKMSADGKLHIK